MLVWECCLTGTVPQMHYRIRQILRSNKYHQHHRFSIGTFNQSEIGMFVKSGNYDFVSFEGILSNAEKAEAWSVSVYTTAPFV